MRIHSPPRARLFTRLWLQVRAEFDDLLLGHAAACGATVVQETKVTEIHFDGARPVAASWAAQDGSGAAGRIDFEYLIDASGRNGLMSVKYLKNRQFSQSLKNVAVWGYWTGAGAYMPGTNRDNAVWIEALEGMSYYVFGGSSTDISATDESGWAWFIPLHNGVVSVGVVMDKDVGAEKRKRYTTGDHAEKFHQFYLDELKRAPGLIDLLGNGQLRQPEGEAAVKTTSDFSYAARDYAGDHFRIAGDAGGASQTTLPVQTDIYCSDGCSLHRPLLLFRRAPRPDRLALRLPDHCCINTRDRVRGEGGALARLEGWHRLHAVRAPPPRTSRPADHCVDSFLIVVLGTYKQMRNQNLAIMSDIDEDNFDRAFDLLRPVINGSADVGRAMTPRELEVRHARLYAACVVLTSHRTRWTFVDTCSRQPIQRCTSPSGPGKSFPPTLTRSVPLTCLSQNRPEAHEPERADYV